MLDAGHGSAAPGTHFTHITCRVGTNQGSFRLGDPRYRRAVAQMPANDPFGNNPGKRSKPRTPAASLDLRLSLRARWAGTLDRKDLAGEPFREDRLKLGPC